MAEPIVIVEYDAAWPKEFQRLRARAVAAVGDVVVAVEHIGSTAIAGLDAKPVIDMVVVVARPDVQTAVDRLSAIGYVHKGNLGVEGREAFTWPNGDRRHHLYVCPTDSEELRAQLAFRDRLLSDPDVAARYATLKHDLAKRFREDRPGYTAAKTVFVERYSR